MKKILAILLSLTLVFAVLALAGCAAADTGDNDGENAGANAGNNEGGSGTELSAFTNALAATAPASSVIKVTTETLVGITLEGLYSATYNSDGSASVSYTYDKLNTFTPGEQLGELVSEVSGSAEIANDGTVSGDVSADVASVAVKNITLDKSKLESYSVIQSGMVATVSAEDLQSVLGVSINGLTSDVHLAIFTNEGKVTSVSVSYTHITLGDVGIVCNYYW